MNEMFNTGRKERIISSNNHNEGMNNKERLYYLDFIRVFSMFCIVIFHFNCSISQHQVYTGDTPIIFYDYINGNGAHIGVTLFFIISGASLMYTYGDKFELKTYFKKRWMGIFPMFYLAWMIAFLFYFFRYYSLNPFMIQRKPWTIVLTILGMDGYLSSIYPNYYLLGEWFLGCIILLYIIFPLLLWLSKKIGITKLLGITFVFYVVLVIFYKLSFPIDMFVLTRIFDIVFGMFVVSKIKELKWYHIILPVVILFVWANWYINIHLMFKITIFGFSLFIVLMYIGKKIKGKAGLLLSKISKYSYAVFLTHHIVLDQVCTHFEGRNYGMRETYVVLLISFIFVFLIAYVLQTIHTKIMGLIKP